jgi:hypothetical protein
MKGQQMERIQGRVVNDDPSFRNVECGGRMKIFIRSSTTRCGRRERKVQREAARPESPVRSLLPLSLSEAEGMLCLEGLLGAVFTSLKSSISIAIKILPRSALIRKADFDSMLVQ